MWRIYVRAVTALGAAIGRHCGEALLIGWKLWTAHRIVRCSIYAFCFCLPILPLLLPAQLGSQSIERTLIQHDARIRALERGQAEMVSTLTRVTEQGSQLNRLSEQVAVLSNQIAERDKFLAWLLAMINSVAVIAAGVAWMIRHRKQQN